jgi:non-canonical purine NTP pyrophosphatase (RdgB/HAM1 family)
MTEVLIATFNENKRRELKALLKGFKKIKILTLKDLTIHPPTIVEDGRTFRQNAVKKAVTMSRFFDGFVVADDSGLEVNFLNGKPGIRSARFARVNATDVENNAKLLKLLEKVPLEKRSAKFVCHIAVAKDAKLLDSFEGQISGKILFEKKGKNGFGYDPLFVPDRHEKTFAEMTAGYKNRISHRAEALKKFKKVVHKYF